MLAYIIFSQSISFKNYKVIDGGKSLVKVTDDGCCMGQKDLPRASQQD
jgi:hypothetical protein